MYRNNSKYQIISNPLELIQLLKWLNTNFQNSNFILQNHKDPSSIYSQTKITYQQQYQYFCFSITNFKNQVQQNFQSHLQNLQFDQELHPIWYSKIKDQESLVMNYSDILYSHLDKKKQQYIIQSEQEMLIQHFTNPKLNKEFIQDKNFQQKKQHVISNALQKNFQQNKQNNNIIDPLQENNPKNDQYLLMCVLANQFQQSGQKLYKTKQYDKLNLLSLQSSFGYGLEDTSCLQLTIQNNDNISYQQLKDQKMLHQFQDQIKLQIAQSFNINPKDINLLQIDEGSIKIFFAIIIAAGVIWKQPIKLLKLIYPDAQLVSHEYFQKIGLSSDDFDPKHNMEWSLNHIEYQLRGPLNDQIKYFFPRGWKGYALNVKGKYDGNDDWLKMDGNPNEWHIMYHGTKQKFVAGILKQGFKVGERQQFKDSSDKKSQQKIGHGVYFSNHIEVAELYADPIQIGNYNYKVVFQSRVRPESLKQIQKETDIEAKKRKNGNPDWDNDYFVVNRSEDIRPYRILLKERKNQENNQKDQKQGGCEVY